MDVYITAVKTDYNEEMPTGYVEIHSIEALAAATGSEIEKVSDTEHILTSEWGNGEGTDQYVVTIERHEQPEFDSEAGNLNLYMPAGYKAKAVHLAERLNARDNQGNPSVSALLRHFINRELKTH